MHTSWSHARIHETSPPPTTTTTHLTHTSHTPHTPSTRQVDRGDLFVALARNIHEDRIKALSDEELKQVRLGVEFSAPGGGEGGTVDPFTPGWNGLRRRLTKASTCCQRVMLFGWLVWAYSRSNANLEAHQFIGRQQYLCFCVLVMRR